jgi:hypothetical protein
MELTPVLMTQAPRSICHEARSTEGPATHQLEATLARLGGSCWFSPCFGSDQYITRMHKYMNRGDKEGSCVYEMLSGSHFLAIRVSMLLNQQEEKEINKKLSLNLQKKTGFSLHNWDKCGVDLPKITRLPLSFPFPEVLMNGKMHT